MTSPRLHPCRWRPGHEPEPAGREERGTAAVELVLLTPLLLAVLCFVVGLGRCADARGQLTGAVRDAARAASLTRTPTAAVAAAQQTAAADLTQAGLSCRGLRTSVDTTAMRPGGMLIVHLWCTVDLSALVVSGLPGQATLRATAAVPLAQFAEVGS